MGVAAVAASMVVPGAASAHEGDGRAEVIPAQVAPGEAVTVVGDGLAANSGVKVELVAAGGTIALGTGMSDADGGVTIEVVVPSDVEARYYELHATDATGHALAGYVEVLPSDAQRPDGAAEATTPAASTGPAWAALAAVAAAVLAAPLLLAMRRGGTPRARRSGPP